MSNLNKIDVPIAVEHHTKLDLSCDHATTMDFMTTQPVNYRHMIKKEHISFNCESVVRPAPIEVPVFGKLVQNIRYFFVPYRLVFPNWDSFYNDVIASNYSDSSLVNKPPVISNQALNELFSTDPTTGYGLAVATTGTYDFIDSQGIQCSFTKPGRWVFKILNSLGYVPIFGKQDSFEFNALGLLAYVKVYVDWYANSQYLNTLDVLSFERLVKFNDPTNYLTLSAADLFMLLTLVYNCVYDVDDYYVNAWDNPVTPNSGQFTSFTFSDPTSTGGAYVQTNVNGSPEMITNNNYPQSIGTTYIHEALKKLTDYQRRHALAGARSIDRVLAQYGVITDSLKQSRSLYLGSQVVNVEIGSVYGTANGVNTAGASTVGDYAGAGFGKSNKTFDFTADEEGVLLCIASIIPLGRMVQGYDRNNLHLSKTDFFVPEFDSLGVQAIEKGEVYVSRDSHFASSPESYRGVFGFSGRYAEYKRPKSFLTGDISLEGFMRGGSSWHLFRLFYDSNFADDLSNVVHSPDFARGKDASQYNRIFQVISGSFEPFYCFMHFNIASYAPCRPLFETYDFDSNSKRVPTENGNKVN